MSWWMNELNRRLKRRNSFFVSCHTLTIELKGLTGTKFHSASFKLEIYLFYNHPNFAQIVLRKILVKISKMADLASHFRGKKPYLCTSLKLSKPDIVCN